MPDDLQVEVSAAEETPALEELPILTVRDTVIYPGALLPITVGRPSSLALVQSLCENNVLGIVANGARASELYSKYTYYYSKSE